MYFSNTGVLTNLIGIGLLANNALFLKCYECGVGESFRNCSNFNSANEYLYVKNCSSDTPNVSCSTTKNEKNVIVERTCVGNIRLNTCAIANGIEYCYCTHDLCNGSSENVAIETDDEDFIEGSGIEDHNSTFKLSKCFTSDVSINFMFHTYYLIVEVGGIILSVLSVAIRTSSYCYLTINMCNITGSFNLPL